MCHALRARLALAVAAPMWSAAAAAQPVVRIASIVELSGAGATSGTNFRNGVLDTAA